MPSERCSRRAAVIAVATTVCAPLPLYAGAYEDWFRAIEVDNVDGIRALLQRGFDPNTVDEKGQVGLFLALRSESLGVARLLAQHPELRVDQTNPHDETPLMMAALRGQVDMAERLLARGAAVDREGWTPLHYAASGPSAAMARLLIARGARVDTASPTGASALQMAARFGSEAIVDVLLAAGASVRWQDRRGLNVAQYARQAGRDTLATRLESLAR